MANTNKVKYGLTNVYYAVATISASDNTATYGTPKRLPGAVNLTMDHQGDANTFYADNIAFFTMQGDAGYSGTLEIAQITDDFRKDILGEIEDANGCLTEVANAPTVPFALLFQVNGDAFNRNCVLYNCSAARPNINAATIGEQAEPQTETIALTAMPRTDGKVQAVTLDTTTASVVSGWYNAVYTG